MYERFTDRARKVMQLAQQEAARFSHEYIDTEHILLGLLGEGSGVAANVLKNLDIDLPNVRAEVEKRMHAGREPGTGRLPQTPRAKKVIEYAIEEARGINHNYVGTEHLLLGLLRERESLTAQVLTHFNLKLEGVREEVLNLLGGNAPAAGSVHVVVDALTTVLNAPPVPPLPYDLTDAQLRIVRKRIKRLNERKETFVAEENFARATKCRDEIDALTRLLAWYVWAQARR